PKAALSTAWPTSFLLELHAPDALRVRRRVQDAVAPRGSDRTGGDARGRLQLEVHHLVARHALRDVPALAVVVAAENAEVRRREERSASVVADDVAHRQIAVPVRGRELAGALLDVQVHEHARVRRDAVLVDVEPVSRR